MFENWGIRQMAEKMQGIKAIWKWEQNKKLLSKNSQKNLQSLKI